VPHSDFQHRLSLAVAPEDEGLRLDRWLAGKLPDRSRSEIQRWIRAGLVAVDGEDCRPAQTLQIGQHVEIEPPPEPAAVELVPQAIALDIVYEDASLVVVNKPSGMVVHPAPGHSDDTLVNAILHHCPDLEGIGGQVRPGIVHRLDKDTSGLIVVAKNDAALRFLQQQFKDRSVHKEYVALLEGRIAPPSGRINVPLGRHPSERKRQAAFPPVASTESTRVREAITEYETEATYFAPASGTGDPANFSLVTARPRTGRTHQLRVHFAWIKHPIVGDTIYGFRRPRLVVPRLFLHARRLSLVLPLSNERATFCAPLPPDLAGVLDELSSS